MDAAEITRRHTARGLQTKHFALCIKTRPLRPALAEWQMRLVLTRKAAPVVFHIAAQSMLGSALAKQWVVEKIEKISAMVSAQLHAALVIADQIAARRIGKFIGVDRHALGQQRLAHAIGIASK